MDAFALRDNEYILIGPLSKKHKYAVRAIPLCPPGPMVKTCTQEPNKGLPIMHAAIVAAFRLADDSLGEWAWLNLSPGAKELIGHVLFNMNHKNEWLGMEVG